MKTIKMLSEMIEEEIDDSEKYANYALKYKTEDPILADAFFKLSQEEMRHVDILHNEVSRIIETYRREHGDPPETMKAVYDFLHQRQIDHVTRVKILQNQFKGM